MLGTPRWHSHEIRTRHCHTQLVAQWASVGSSLLCQVRRTRRLPELGPPVQVRRRLDVASLVERWVLVVQGGAVLVVVEVTVVGPDKVS